MKHIDKAPRKLVAVKGKGTDKEQREQTNITVYPVVIKGRQVWVSIPED